MKPNSRAGTAITIRSMKADDLTRVHELDQICFSSPWSLRIFQQELEENQSSSQWVAVLGETSLSPGLIVGAVVIWLVADEVHIDLHDAEISGCILQFMNMQGQVLIERNIELNEYKLPLGAYDAGHYLLRIVPGKSAPRTFKIIKTK